VLAGFTPKQGDPSKDRVVNLQVICIGAYIKDILNESFKQAVLVEFNPEGLIV
jgi:hypothetical protein